mmetsp:Transcript_48083/g.61623  ORF Transcript_48083/g.61623 Transcript_48083/m.61623 type:complete len:319 (-) Transcript_48083:223-1179(-)
MAENRKTKLSRTFTYGTEVLNIDNNIAITTVSGSISGFAATIAKQPIQRIKWIRQVHEGPSIPYKQIVKNTVDTLGTRGFFAGSMASIYRNVPHSMLAFSVYPIAENFMFYQVEGHPLNEKKSSRTFSTRFWAGYLTLFFTTLITHPLDTLRVRLSVHSDAATLGAFRTSAHIWKHEGFSSFYRGFGATLLGAGPRGAIGFGIFESLKPILDKVEGLDDYKVGTRFFAGYTAGFMSEFFIYPLDTIRRRQQALGDATCISRQNVLEALRHIFRTEGVRGMFKGISLNLVKNPLATGVSFLVNDHVKEALGYVPHGPQD